MSLGKGFCVIRSPLQGRLIGQNRFCATSCNCTKQFCAKSSYCTKRVLCNKASHNKTGHLHSCGAKQKATKCILFLEQFCVKFAVHTVFGWKSDLLSRKFLLLLSLALTMAGKQAKVCWNPVEEQQKCCWHKLCLILREEELAAKPLCWQNTFCNKHQERYLRFKAKFQNV